MLKAIVPRVKADPVRITVKYPIRTYPAAGAGNPAIARASEEYPVVFAPAGKVTRSEDPGVTSQATAAYVPTGIVCVGVTVVPTQFAAMPKTASCHRYENAKWSILEGVDPKLIAAVEIKPSGIDVPLTDPLV
jgi:hypothetical protein